jgi:hypothetical protein
MILLSQLALSDHLLGMKSKRRTISLADFHVSHLSSGGRVSRARSGERVNHHFQDAQRATCASRNRFLRSADPDIHLLSRALEGRHRRLSLCSLPVPKQFVESLGSAISSLSRRTAGSGSLRILFILLISAVSMLPESCGLPQVRSLSVVDLRQADTRPSSGLPHGAARWLFPFCPSPS